MQIYVPKPPFQHDIMTLSSYFQESAKENCARISYINIKHEHKQKKHSKLGLINHEYKITLLTLY